MTTASHDLLTSLFQKRFGKEAKIIDLEQAPSQGAEGEYLPTGSVSLNLQLGVGGFKRGTVNEVYGPESSGKSTLTIDLMREAQKYGPVALIDSEHAFNKDYAEAIGMDLSPSRFFLVQENETEAALNMASFFAEQGVALVVVDSVPGLTPKAQIESNDTTEAKMGGNAKFLSTHLPQMVSTCSKTGTTAVYVNQVREKLGVMFGDPETTPGGRALKFFSSLRIRTSVSGQIKEDGKVIGVEITAKVVKNKIGGAPYRKAVYPIIFGKGIDCERDLGNLAIELGMLGAGAGGRYVFGEQKFHGKEAVYQWLRDDQTAAKILADTIWSNV